MLCRLSRAPAGGLWVVDDALGWSRVADKGACGCSWSIRLCWVVEEGKDLYQDVNVRASFPTVSAPCLGMPRSLPAEFVRATHKVRVPQAYQRSTIKGNTGLASGRHRDGRFSGRPREIGS